MTDRSHYRATEDEIRSQMSIIIQVLRPYAQSSGGFVNWDDVRAAIRAAEHALEKASLAANHRLPPTP
jgi:hypothetical protein